MGVIARADEYLLSTQSGRSGMPMSRSSFRRRATPGAGVFEDVGPTNHDGVVRECLLGGPDQFRTRFGIHSTSTDLVVELKSLTANQTVSSYREHDHRR
jgi:hypothetical protein